MLGCLAFTISGFLGVHEAETKPLILLTSTFPIYQITRNVTHGLDSITVELMIPAALGCPHDYALTPRDMQKLAKSDVFVINGLGMEEFLGAPVEKANPELAIIDSSAGIKDILRYSDVEGGHHEHHGHHEHKEHQEDHHHKGENPHLFASPRMAAHIAQGIAQALSKIDPAHKESYLANGNAYAEKLTRLADDFTTLGKRLENNRIVTQHGVFDYLARDMGLKLVAVVQAHAGQEPSAADMLNIVKTIKDQHAGAIFTEPQYPDKIGKTIAREAGIQAAVLDPAATGDENAPLNYYETVMAHNLKTLENTLGTKSD